MTPRRSLYARSALVRGQQCTTGALLAPTAARSRQRGGAEVAKLATGREDYHARELATDHQAYPSGHGESPGVGTAPAPPHPTRNAEHRSGFRRMLEIATHRKFLGDDRGQLGMPSWTSGRVRVSGIYREHPLPSAPPPRSSRRQCGPWGSQGSQPPSGCPPTGSQLGRSPTPRQGSTTR
jgi:hypothetical protein